MSKIKYILLGTFFLLFVYADVELDLDDESFFILDEALPSKTQVVDVEKALDGDASQVSEIKPPSADLEGEKETTGQGGVSKEPTVASEDAPKEILKEEAKEPVLKSEETVAKVEPEPKPLGDDTVAQEKTAPVKEEAIPVEPSKEVVSKKVKAPDVEFTEESVPIPHQVKEGTENPVAENEGLIRNPKLLDEKEEGFVGEAVPSEMLAEAAPEDVGRDVISVDFPEEQIRLIIRSVAELYDLNVVIPNNLQGSASIRLRNVTWEEIFKAVLEPIGFTYVVDGNIIKIKSLTDIAKEPFETIFIPLSHSEGKEVVKNLKQLIDTSSGSKVASDERTNILILTERKSRIPELRKIIEKMDAAEPQVMIETKFIEITDNDQRDLGIKWTAFSSSGYTAALSGAGGKDGGPFFREFFREKGTKDGESQITDYRKDTAVLNFGEFNMVLYALDALTKSKIVSMPTVVTMNNTSAHITIAQKYPVPQYTYNETSGNFSVSGFDYKDIGTLLKVTPKAQNRFISLKVQPEISNKEDTNATFGQASIPIINTKTADTIVTMRSGYTLALGGLMKTTKSKTRQRIPLLGYIPILGDVLFSYKQDKLESSNLIVFVTATQIGYDGKKELYDEPNPKVMNIDSKRMFELGLSDYDFPNYQTETEKARYAEIQRLKALIEERERSKKLSQVSKDYEEIYEERYR